MTTEPITRETPGTPGGRPGAGVGLRLPDRLAPDLTTLLGLAASFGVLAVAMIADSDASAYYDPASLLVVFGGTAAVTMVSFSAADLGDAGRGVLQALVRPRGAPAPLARHLVLLAEAARRGGPEALKTVTAELHRDPLLQRAIGLAADGLPAETLRMILTAEAEAALAKRSRAAALLRRAAEVAPAMGLIGTLIGLVKMLGHLQDPAAIGPGMALALLTTFYGAVLGNMILHPLAGKLETNAESEALARRLCLMGVVSIADQEPPRRLEVHLNTVLPPSARVRLFDKDPT